MLSEQTFTSILSSLCISPIGEPNRNRADAQQFRN